MSDNRLGSLAGLEALSSLTRLVADDNPLQDAAALPGMLAGWGWAVLSLSGVCTVRPMSSVGSVDAKSLVM